MVLDIQPNKPDVIATNSYHCSAQSNSNDQSFSKIKLIIPVKHNRIPWKNKEPENREYRP